MCCNDDCLFDKVGIDEVDSQLVAHPVGDLCTQLSITPWPISRLRVAGVRRMQSSIENDNRGFHAALVIDNDSQWMELALCSELKETDCSTAESRFIIRHQYRIGRHAGCRTKVTAILDIQRVGTGST